MDRRSAAIFWKKRRMDVDDAKPWGHEHRVGEDLSVCGHNTEVGIERPERVQELLITQALGLQNVQAVAERKLFDRARP